jgi:phospholipid/cholesterol/gamma-HCH transport system ATP-binding protein
MSAEVHIEPSEAENLHAAGDPAGQTIIPDDLSVSDIFTAVDDQTRVVPALEFRHVSFAYEDRPVLQDVSFKLMRGELLIMLSGSGGGKSTILSLAIGLIKPDEGQILINGEDITGYDESRLNRVRQGIGMSFQGGALFDSLSVYDNVAFRYHEEGVVPEGKIEEDVHRILRFLNIEDAIDMLPNELSGGMRVRVGLARTLVFRPHTILLDEPTQGLDPPMARKLCELSIFLRDLLDVTSILVTHGIENVRFITSTYAVLGSGRRAVLKKEGDQLCLANTKIMMLRKGQIIFHGTDEQLFKTEDPYIREFLLL